MVTDSQACPCDPRLQEQVRVRTFRRVSEVVVKWYAEFTADYSYRYDGLYTVEKVADEF